MTPIPSVVYSCVPAGEVVLTAVEQAGRRVTFSVDSRQTSINDELPDEVGAALPAVPLVFLKHYSAERSEYTLQDVPQPCLRYGAAQDQGRRSYMEDVYTAVTDLSPLFGDAPELPSCCGFFGVFDGHGGVTAASFVSENILNQVVARDCFLTDVKAALREAFRETDRQYYEACKASCKGEDSGSTALAAVVWGQQLYIANAGDCRAVLCRRGKAVELTTDHKPSTASERQRIEACGGFVCSEGMLMGELSVARGFGDYHISETKAMPDVNAPLTAEPEVADCTLTSEDEFLLLGCDGLWDVFSSQRAVEFARQRLREHNDPERCSQELVQEALNMHSGDNVSVLTVCFTDRPPPRRVYSTFQRSVSRDGLSMLARALSSRPDAGSTCS